MNPQNNQGAQIKVLSLRLTYINALLITGAFVASLYFNGLDLRFFALTLCLLSASLALNSVHIYRHGWNMGNLLIPIMLALFWFWLGISIFFSQVGYLSIVNFWWVGIFPLAFLVYSSTSDKDDLWKLLIKLITFVVFLLCIFALYQVFALHEQPRATFYNKNSFAALINLLLFPVLAFILLNTDRKQLTALLIALFIFTLLLGLINSRGALISCLISLVLFATLEKFHIVSRRFYSILIIMAIALLTANIALHFSPHITGDNIVDRIITLQDTGSAGYSRFVIWQPAWDLFLQQPWSGIGLGSYFLAIPPLLHIDDHSAGFYVHNDYLQIALETGIPGFLFLTAILFVTAFRFSKVIRIASHDAPQRIIFISLFAGLFSVAFHSIFSFNLYILPIMLLVGLFLGHFNYLADLLQNAPTKQWQPSVVFRPFVYYFCVAIMAFTLFSYFATLGFAYHYQQYAYRLALDGKLKDAHQAYRLAQILDPRTDSAYYADANLLRKIALVLDDRPDLVNTLLDEAIILLDRAEELNPLRPNTPYIRGLIVEQYPDADKTEVIDAYQTALSRDPRFLPARIALARYFIKLDKNDAANQLLREGLEFSYRQVTQSYLELIELNHAAAERTGNTELAHNLSAIFNNYQQIYADMKSHGDLNNIINP